MHKTKALVGVCYKPRTLWKVEPPQESHFVWKPIKKISGKYPTGRVDVACVDLSTHTDFQKRLFQKFLNKYGEHVTGVIVEMVTEAHIPEHPAEGFFVKVRVGCEIYMIPRTCVCKKTKK